MKQHLLPSTVILLAIFKQNCDAFQLQKRLKNPYSSPCAYRSISGCVFIRNLTPLMMSKSKNGSKSSIFVNIEAFLLSVPKVLKLGIAGLALWVMFFELTKIVFVMSIPIMIIVGMVISTFLSGGLALVLVGTVITWLCSLVFFPLVSSISVISIATLALSSYIASFVIRSLLTEPTQTNQVLLLRLMTTSLTHRLTSFNSNLLEFLSLIMFFYSFLLLI